MQLTVENERALICRSCLQCGNAQDCCKTPVKLHEMTRNLSRLSNHVMRFLFDVAVAWAVST